MTEVGAKTCSGCRETKPFGLFYKDRQKKDGLTSRCTACTKAVRATEAESERRKAYLVEWRVRNRQYLQAQAWLRRMDNPAQMEKERANRLKYGAESAMRRHAIRLKATPAWSNAAEMRVVYAGAKRMQERFGRRFEVDHIVPLRSAVVCGLHCHANLQVLDKTYNARKSNHWWPDMWPKTEGATDATR